MSTTRQHGLSPQVVDKWQDIEAICERDRAAYLAAIEAQTEPRERVRVTWARVNEYRRRSPAFEDLTVEQIDALTATQRESLNIKADDFAAWQAARRLSSRAQQNVERACQRARASNELANHLREFVQQHGVKV